MRIAFDIETDGLLRGLSVIHCIVAQDIDTKEIFRFEPENIKAGLKFLQGAEALYGHNIIGYDFQAIKELYPRWKYSGKAYDTLILSRLFFTDILDRDFRQRAAGMPANLYGRHSLEAWGHRLGFHKSQFGKTLDGDWSTYSPEMLDYCQRDVEVSTKLVELFLPKMEQYAQSIETEHTLAHIMAWQETSGFPFDVSAAQELESKLRTELDTLSTEMRNTFVFVDGGEFTPKRPNKTRGYVADAPMCRLKEFNPTSRDHVAWAFKVHRGWEPREYTNTGRAKIDEKILEEIGTPESLKFARILELQKHLGQLSEGKNAWLKKVGKDGRIHHSCVLNTNTGRMAHMGPNLAQVPSAPEYRALFGPGSNRIQLGSDASGLELRCLGHYLAPFDGGKFAKEVVEGDIHTHLSNIYGTDRKSGKSVTYCLIYGGGNTKLGLTAGAGKSGAAKRGSEIRNRILSGLDGFKQLSDAVKTRASTGVLRGLDGRPIRLMGKEHAALNYLLQSAGAIICKRWVIRTHELLHEAGIDFTPLAFVHDEQQLSIKEEDIQRVGDLVTQAMHDVQRSLGFRCQLDSEYQTGSNWADCH